MIDKRVSIIIFAFSISTMAILSEGTEIDPTVVVCEPPLQEFNG